MALGGAIHHQIAQPLDGKQRQQIHDLAVLAPFREPTGQQAPVAKRDSSGELEPLSQKRQPLLHAAAIAPRLKAGDLHQPRELALAAADGAEITHLRELIALQRQGHPKAAFSGVLHRPVVVMGEQNLAGHGAWASLQRFWPQHPHRHRPQLWPRRVIPWPAHATAVASGTPQPWRPPVPASDLSAPRHHREPRFFGLSSERHFA